MGLPKELHLTEDEATSNAEAQLAFQREFDVVLPAKVQAGIALLAVTLGTMKGKLAALGERRRREREAAQTDADPLHFKGPVNQPWRRAPPPPPPTPAGEDLVMRSGSAFILPTGPVPDSGKIDFGKMN